MSLSAVSWNSLTALPGKPGQLSFRFRLPNKAIGRLPLFWSGEPGAGDLIFIEFDAARMRIGHDHWGSQAKVGDWRARTSDFHEISIALPLPAGAGNHGETLRVVLDDQVVLHHETALFPFNARAWTVGWNLAGASTAETFYSGDIWDLRVSPANPSSN
jgi:hypothetical protein